LGHKDTAHDYEMILTLLQGKVLTKEEAGERKPLWSQSCLIKTIAKV
jgi:hypothetical protein